jgi:hypothetical protein
LYNYEKIKKIHDFKMIKNFGKTTIKNEKPILEDVLQIINKYNVRVGYKQTKK